MAASRFEIPVYLFTGFLESGKTKYIQETLCDPRFNSGEKTLLLVCEEGVEEYDPSAFSGRNVFIHVLENEEDFTPETLCALQQKSAARRVVLEYNGMWQLGTLYSNLPANWTVYQEFMFADAGTFVNYNANMRQLVVDKLQSAELVIFNRMRPSVDKMALHKIVRGISRKADIAYESAADGSVEYDDIEDPLPFDINAPVIEIEDKDYALWYRDVTENMDQYRGKTVHFKGLVAIDAKMPAGSFVLGRHVMTCCVNDITYMGVVCCYEHTELLQLRQWVSVKAEIRIEKHRIYGSKKGPVLYVSELTHATKPEDEVATFY